MQSTLSTYNYNILYSKIRSFVSQKYMSYSIKTFMDGGAVINITITGSNVSVTCTVLISAIHSTNGDITGYRVSNEDDYMTYANIEDTLIFVKMLVHKTRMIITKVK